MAQDIQNQDYSSEIVGKLRSIRQAMTLHNAESIAQTPAVAIRLRGTDWFSWATAGAAHTVLLAAESGVAEVLVTASDAWIVTDEIEAQRFQDEEMPGREGYQLYVHPWADPIARDTFVREVAGSGKVLSDRPTATESALPTLLLQHRRVMLPSELDRYRRVGRLASEAMTEVLIRAQPTWTEYQLAGAGAEALWARGLHPALTLAAGDRRVGQYRHPIPTGEAIGHIGMLVFCARGWGLYASLTRFVCFGSLSSEEAKLHQQVREVEAVMLDASQPDVPLSQVYDAIDRAYHDRGYPNAIREHHQGGTTGYLAREIVANPTTGDRLTPNTAIAWNPSLPGAKIEDTFVLLEGGRLENLTFDPGWKSVRVAGRDRPMPLER